MQFERRLHWLDRLPKKRIDNIVNFGGLFFFSSFFHIKFVEKLLKWVKAFRRATNREDFLRMEIKSIIPPTHFPLPFLAHNSGRIVSLAIYFANRTFPVQDLLDFTWRKIKEKPSWWGLRFYNSSRLLEKPHSCHENMIIASVLKGSKLLSSCWR